MDPNNQREYRSRDKNQNNDRDRSSSRHDKKKKKKHNRDDESFRYERRRSQSERRHGRKHSRSRDRDRKYNRRQYRRDSPQRRDWRGGNDRYHGDRGRDRGYRGGDRGDRDYRGGRRERVEKDPYFEQRKEIEKMRQKDPEKAEEMQNQLEKKIILDQKQREYEQMKQKFREAQKEMQDAKRQDMTIIVYCLPLRAKEKHIWKFFNEQGCGKIRDIKIIRDPRSNRSKGVAYVEFYTTESVEKALLLSQRPFQLKGRFFTSLKVQHSQAERNRAAAAAKRMKVTKPIDPIQQAQETQKRQMKVFVGGLTDKLSEIQQSELKQLFEPFGPIDYVDIHRDAMTGKCKGFAFIQYSSTEDAKKAVIEMNNLAIGGQRITVQTVSTVQKVNSTPGDQYLHSAGNKAALMNKLSREAPSHSNLMRPPISTMCTPYLLLTNLFKMEGTIPKFFQDLKKEVTTQCSEFGIVEKCFVQKNNQGNVWVKFSDTASAIKAQENLNGKYFDNAKLFCYFVTENTYQTRVGI